MAYPENLDLLPEDITSTTYEDAEGKEHDVMHRKANEQINTIKGLLGVTDDDDETTFTYKVTQLMVLLNRLVDGDGNLRIKDLSTNPELQIWDQVGQGWRTIVCENGQLATSTLEPEA